PYEIQHLGANPVYYYQHPTLDIAIDLRGEEEAARMMYVFPTETGFTVTHRQAISYAIGSLRDYPGGMDVESITVQIDLLSPEEEQAEIAAISTRRLEGEEVLVEWVRVKDGALYVRDNMAGGPDSAWYAKELYNSSVFFDHVYLSHHLVESAQPGVQVEETPGDANAEWAEIVSLLHTNPAEFEWRYSMPPYSRDPRPAVGLPNWAFLEDLSTVPIYEYGALDLNGDGFYEYLVHCCCDSYEYGPERYGYWVVFTETPYGLRLIGFCGSGEANLVYSDDHFYFLGARGQYGDNSFFAEEHSIPVPATYLRPLEYTYFTNLNELIIMESEGDSLDPWASWVIVPKHFTSDEGYEYFDYYVINSFEFWGVVGTLDGALSDRATVVPIRTPYTVPPGETVVQLQDPYRMRNFVDYLDSEFHYFPFAEQDWDNAVSVSSVLALGPPLTEDKVMSLLPHPELLDY
ncbi:MAG TPA: hypothetical protein PK646_02725, partial [Bacillota bacterium]|nr:hypothetical protein [Bacillota bacterium]